MAILGVEDEYYRVSFRRENNDEALEGYMDVDGTVVMEKPKLYENTGGTTITLYDENGQETFASSDDENMYVLGASNGVYLVQETRSGLDESAWYVGVMDANGNWLDGPFNMTEMTGTIGAADVLDDMGEGMMAVYTTQSHSNILVIFDSENGACFSISDVWNDDLQFRNGTLIFQHWSGGTSIGKKGTICSVTKDGTLTELATEGELLSDGDNGFVTDANNLSFYDRSGNLQWSFDNYELVDTPVFYDDFVFIFVRGADGATYAGCLSQQTGELVYEPFKASPRYVYEHIVLTEVDDQSAFVDLLTGETVSVPDLDIDLTGLYDEIQYWEKGLYVIRHYEGKDASPQYDLYFFDAQGQEVTPTLKTN